MILAKLVICWRKMFKFVKKYIGQRSFVRLGWHFLKALLAAMKYGFPARDLTVIGITGTDGKTTTVGMIRHILENNGKSVGSFSTTEFRINGKRIKNKTQKTSISPDLLQKNLRQMVKSGCKYAVVEMSSHGLVQGRVHHTYPQVAGITNTSEEHLDYHGTMEQYRKDKGKIFKMLNGKGVKVLNFNDGTYPLFRKIHSSRTVVYSTDGTVPPTEEKTPQRLWLTSAKANFSGVSASLHADEVGPFPLVLPIPGLFNLENALCAVGCSNAVGVSLKQCVEALKTYQGESGRMQKIDEGQPFAVYADFTVSPGAYEKTLKSLREMVKEDGRVLVLAGSCGDRMREKRPVIGKICSRLADTVVVTSDESYGEPYGQIMDDIIAGIAESECKLHRITDRREAIKFILSEAKKNDLVVICGMAGVTTMMTPQGQIPWDEVEIIREILKDREF